LIALKITLLCRRYKLAHITTNNQETQTDTNGGVQAAVNMKGLPPHVIDALTDARNDLLQIQEQNEVYIITAGVHKSQRINRL
jgi:hypothetical protein